MKSEFTPLDKAFEKRVRESFLQQGIMRLIGAELVTLEPGRVEIEIANRPALAQQDGYMHAGIITTILDSACGYAAYTLMPPASRVLSVEFKVNLVAPAEGAYVVATANVKKAGKTLTVCSADAFADGKLCATMLATIICLPAREAERA